MFDACLYFVTHGMADSAEWSLSIVEVYRVIWELCVQLCKYYIIVSFFFLWG